MLPRVRRRRLGRILLVWAIDAVAFWLLAAVLPGVDLEGWGSAIAAAAVVGLLNALVWPAVILVALPLAFYTAGLGALVLNGLVLEFADDVLPGLEVGGLWSAIGATLVLAALTTSLSALLAVDDDDSFHRRVVLRALRRAPAEARTDVPGVIFLEIDGLSIDTLRRAVRDGHVPMLARWLQEGSHRLVPWECDLSSQTGASQAGLLHGNNDDLPAFRWYEKESGRVMVSNHPADAAELERRASDGNGLLARDGASRGNLCSGDAPRSLFTMSTGAKGREVRDLYAFFADPGNMARLIVLSVADIGRELRAAAQQRRRDVRPRVDRGGIYPLLRASTTVMLRDLAIATLVGDVLRGVPIAYATFVAYDEVAHHSGVERHDALDTLRRLDRQFARLVSAAALAPRPYRFVVLSDHGQSQGATFRQRYGHTLEKVVRDAIADGRRVAAMPTADEGWGQLTSALTDAAGGEGARARVVGRAARGRRADEEALARRTEAEAAEADAIVMPSGCLALIYLRGSRKRMTREEIDATHPRLIPALAAHPGIAFVLVHSAADGPLAIGADGVHHLAGGRVEGEDPLAPFPATAAHHLGRTDGFAHAPDLLVNAVYDPDTDEVPAFEELVGSHGGLGGAQARPFALVPADWDRPTEPVVGAEAMHRQMQAWVAAAQVTELTRRADGDTAAR
jgi:uncharacterized membrane protein YvlD (DUF360 family)